jgi:hypothetical protein
VASGADELSPYAAKTSFGPQTFRRCPSRRFLIAKILMAHQFWTVRRPAESKLRGRFYASGGGPISSVDKIEICRRLGIWLTPDTLFEPAFKSVEESFLSPEPDFTGENGRNFWVYRMDQQLPI